MRRPLFSLLLLAAAAGGGSQATVAAHSPLSTHTAAKARAGATATNLPALGARGYPADVYPAPGKVVNPPQCPSGKSLQPMTSAAEATVRAVLAGFGHRSLAADLHHSDRAWWPQVLNTWRSPYAQKPAYHVRHHGPPAGTLYAGLLTAPYPQSRLGAPDWAPRIAAGCGQRVARDSHVIVTGPPAPAGLVLQSAWFFLDRRGHVLLYFIY